MVDQAKASSHLCDLRVTVERIEGRVT